MKKTALLIILALLPLPLRAQQDPSERLREVLPPDVVDQILQVIATAQSHDLPSQAVANLALEGVAKGRSADEVLAAVEQLVSDMGQAQQALLSVGHAPEDGEVEAATVALRMGVDGASISELAKVGPSGRSLAVPLLVMGGLAERGLPSDQALAAVRDRLAARATDAALLGSFPDIAPGLGNGVTPDQVGTALAGGLAGFQVPASGTTVPVGPQSDQGRGPEGRGGRGGPPGS